MNQIERAFSIPDWKWLKHSQIELSMEDDDIEGMTDFIWRIGEIAVVGFIYHNYLSPPWMWFLLAEGIKIGDLMDFRRLTTMIPSGTLTGIKADYAEGVRFAKLYGFDDTGEARMHKNVDYKIFRRR